MVIVWATMSTAPDCRDSLSVGHGFELDLVGVAKDRLRDGVHHVDVKPLDLPVPGVEVAEVVGALIHTRDEVTAGAVLGHERARSHRRRPGRPQAGRGITRAGRGGLRRHGPGQLMCWRGKHRRGPGYGPRGQGPCHEQQRQQGPPVARLHRYSASRLLSPRAHPAAMISASTMTPTSKPVNAFRPATALAWKTAWSAEIARVSESSRRVNRVPE